MFLTEISEHETIDKRMLAVQMSDVWLGRVLTSEGCCKVGRVMPGTRRAYKCPLLLLLLSLAKGWVTSTSQTVWSHGFISLFPWSCYGNLTESWASIWHSHSWKHKFRLDRYRYKCFPQVRLYSIALINKRIRYLAIKMNPRHHLTALCTDKLSVGRHNNSHRRISLSGKECLLLDVTPLNTRQTPSKQCC